MAENDGLTIQDRYDIAYAKGFRIGYIESARESAIMLIKEFGKPGKRLVHKINHEVDTRILRRIYDLLFNKSVTVEALEDIYDDLISPKEELGINDNGDES